MISRLPEATAETARSVAAYELLRNAQVPMFIVDRAAGLYVANSALAATFGYPSAREPEELLQNGEFLQAHCTPAAIALFYEALFKDGAVHDWPLRGRSRDGRALFLEVSARARLTAPQGPAEQVEALLIEPCLDRESDAYLQKARSEADLAAKAKNEFLSNISHELRTPLNIIIGMLSLALEDEGAGEELRQNLGLAKDAADGLFSIVNDLITLSSLEARRLTSDLAQFSPNLLVGTLARQFAATAEAKGVRLATESSERGDVVLEGGYNLIMMALEKLLHNAIKFVAQGGEVIMKADVTVNGDGPWLRCMVLDNGPGLDEALLARQELFRQGDGSINRRHGGLGLGLSLASSLTALLGGRLILTNREGGGAETGFVVPVKFSTVDYGG